jgi:hypothetical protein
MNGSQVVNLFSEKAVMPFILEFHDVLHCEGTQAIAAQIDDYILNRE